jgi:hypothetical protein
MKRLSCIYCRRDFWIPFGGWIICTEKEGKPRLGLGPVHLPPHKFLPEIWIYPILAVVFLLNSPLLLGRLWRAAFYRISNAWATLDKRDVCLPLLPQVCLKLPKIVGPGLLEAVAFVLSSALVLVCLCGLLENARILCRLLQAAL